MPISGGRTKRAISSEICCYAWPPDDVGRPDGGNLLGMSEGFDDRAAGWLRFLERKLAIPEDDWSKSGTPALAWDNISGAPTSSWYRFDAIGIATTLMLASRGGTLDTRVAAALLDGIVDRLRRYHGFNEWVEQQGPDPKHDDYPKAWRGTLIPESLWGSYDTPGWASNGIQGKGFEPNPVEAQGAIYFKGFFNYVLGLRALIEPTDGTRPINIVYDDTWSFQYSHNQINSIVAGDFENALAGRSDGLCCEVHKLWPL